MTAASAASRSRTMAAGWRAAAAMAPRGSDVASGRQVALINSRNGSTRSVRFTSTIDCLSSRDGGASAVDYRLLAAPNARPREGEGLVRYRFQRRRAADDRCGDYGSVRMWDLGPGFAVASWVAHAGSVTGLAWDKSAARVISTGADGQVVALDSSTPCRSSPGISARRVAVSPGRGVLTARSPRIPLRLVTRAS